MSQSLSIKPRVRVLSNGWIRHDGSGMPPWLGSDARVAVRVVSGNASFMDGLRADCFRGWKHIGFSADILLWRPFAPASGEQA